MRAIFFSFCILLHFMWISSVLAGDDAYSKTCILEAPPQNDVWVIVYDADDDGNRKNIIWKGKVAAGKSVNITSTEGHIRYQYTYDENDPYKGDTSLECDQNNSFLID